MLKNTIINEIKDQVNDILILENDDDIIVTIETTLNKIRTFFIRKAECDKFYCDNETINDCIKQHPEKVFLNFETINKICYINEE